MRYTRGDSSRGKPPQRGITTFIGETIPEGACPIVRAYLHRWASKKQTRSISSTMATGSLAARDAEEDSRSIETTRAACWTPLD
eukprot:2200222-Pyramimonas_sp.AAC.1